MKKERKEGNRKVGKTEREEVKMGKKLNEQEERGRQMSK